jgi:hypothetical protein
MAKTPDMNPQLPLKNPISEGDLFIRLEYSSLRYYMDDSCEKLHRNEGPAVIHNNGCLEYWNQGQLHNISGPAIETVKGKSVYYLFGRRFTYENWLLAKKQYLLDNNIFNSVIKVHENNGDTKS